MLTIAMSLFLATAAPAGTWFDHYEKGVHLIDGRVPHSIIGELFTDKGVGSWITA